MAAGLSVRDFCLELARAGIVVLKEDSGALAVAMHDIAREDEIELRSRVESLAQKFDLKRSVQRWLEAVEAGK